jgi:hypothetical protein
MYLWNKQCFIRNILYAENIKIQNRIVEPKNLE